MPAAEGPSATALPPAAATWIRRLRLEPHPEGGYYRRTYRSRTPLPGHDAERVVMSAIQYLLPGSDISRLHRLGADESWHFFTGSPLELVMIDADGRLERVILGPAVEEGQQFQAVVPAGRWFGARVRDPAGWTLVGCTVAPGFEYSDFEFGERVHLIARFPRHASLIETFTRA